MQRFKAKMKALWELIQLPLFALVFVAGVISLVVVLGNLKMANADDGSWALWFVAGLGSMLLVDYIIKYV